MPSRKHPLPVRLNPLAFPSETDMRFLLLVLAAAGTLIGLGDFAAYVLLQYLPVDPVIAPGIATSSAFLIAVLVFIVTHRRAIRAAQKLIREEHWVPFPPQRRDRLEQASLERMQAHIARILAELPAVAAQQPQFCWNDTSSDSQAPIGMAFGYRSRQYVCLNEGLHAAFLGTPQAQRFHAVLLHELGHIANRDVSRTTFSIELGRTFTPVALILVAITGGHLIFHLIRRFFAGKTDQLDIQSLEVVVRTGVGMALLLALIPIIRAGILRVREYYADARACQWLGSEVPLRELFAQPRQVRTLTRPLAAETREGSAKQPAFRLKRPLRKLFHTYLAPLHPAYTRRINTLVDPVTLFRAEPGTVWIAGLLSGVALNANSIVLNVPMHVGGLTTAWLANNINPELSSTTLQLIFALSVVLGTLAFTILAALFITIFLAPLVGTVGVMVLRASFVDSIEYPADALVPLRRVMLLALLVGAGIVLGSALTPVQGVLSFDKDDWWLAPIFVIVWAGVVVVWLLPLRWFGRRAFRSYVGVKPPTIRRRCIAVLSGLAIMPVWIVTMLGQGAVTTADIDPVSPEFAAALFVAWVLSFPFSLLIWSAGALLMWLAGWFRSAPCPECGKTTKSSKVTALHCTQCGHPLLAWAVVPAPLRMPPPPPRPSIPLGTAPPPL